MTGEPDDTDELRAAIRRRAQRDKRGEEFKAEGEQAIWKNLSLIGALGWLIVVPPLAGGLLGRWLDRLFGYTILWSGVFILVGVVLGAWLAWQRANRE